MRLGTETASLVNHIQSRSVIGQPQPVAGMGVTFLHWTDRSPGTIFRVFTVGKTTYIETRDDDYRRTDSNGMSEEQSYKYTTLVNGYKRNFRIGRKGLWEEVRRNEAGRWVKAGGCGLQIGRRNAYHDFSF
jgi:hypothetical protein